MLVDLTLHHQTDYRKAKFQPIIFPAMKKTSYITFLIAVTIAVSCQKETQPMTNSLENLAKQNAILAAGAWRVSYFYESGKDLTSDFSTYLLKFESDGSAAVHSTGIGVLYFGMWNLMKTTHNQAYTSGNHTVESVNNKMLITLPGNFHMDEMSGNWEITRLTDSEIWLRVETQSNWKEIHLAIVE